ncbi:DUF1003 domain-containing protein [Paraburkholderia aromaticivorans]|uniref:DUF1003 domain-containing protein n=1 Tax=Paraburkholderia aromaticivorans TaxID=2026199 RepID=UPI00197E70F6|nr:DUF1003 domain-containing protein [Paraburkholderia aromaticivorans]
MLFNSPLPIRRLQVIFRTTFVSVDSYPATPDASTSALEQAAYAAPLILLAQTRQADRDKAHSDADARHREDLAKASEERQLIAANQTELLLGLLQQNTQLTELTKQMSEHIEALTLEWNKKLTKPGTGTQV